LESRSVPRSPTYDAAWGWRYSDVSVGGTYTYGDSATTINTLTYNMTLIGGHDWRSNVVQASAGSASEQLGGAAIPADAPQAEVIAEPEVFVEELVENDETAMQDEAIIEETKTCEDASDDEQANSACADEIAMANVKFYDVYFKASEYALAVGKAD